VLSEDAAVVAFIL